MIRRTAGAAALAATLTIAATPAGASTRQPSPPAGALDVAAPSAPLRDTVLERPSRSLARATASASSGSYPVNDGAGRNVSVSVTPTCSSLCSDANPQTIASFLGTLAHRDEISLLNVDVVHPTLEMPTICGPGALACYFLSQNRMVISGNDSTAPDGATREFVIAHEYGHHLANHRQNPPFGPTIDYGPKRWATYERVCEGVRDRFYYPGDENQHYYDNPGEAFAESFAFNRFPTAPVAWQWNASLKPDGSAFAAIQRDALNPWIGRKRSKKRGRLPFHGRNRVAKRIATPLDGALTLKLHGRAAAGLDLLLRDQQGRTLASTQQRGSDDRLSFTVCGQSGLRAVVKRTGSGSGRFRLAVLRP